jgi:FHS family L-fucose permease-like MFS transporter
MAIITNSNVKATLSKPGQSFLLPLILVTSLFFLWGLAYGLLDVLNKHFQEALNITKQRSTLLQVAYFGAYFLMALPAGIFMNRLGYKKGIIIGLLLYSLGAFLFYPSAATASFTFFLVSLFILASGLTFLETAANPYITVLGAPETSAFRLNLSQSFNGVGSFIGPIIGAQLFFNSTSSTSSGNLDSVKMVYLGVGGIVLLIAILFMRTPLPEIKESESTGNETSGKSLFAHSHFIWAVAAQFFCVAAQVGVAALFINYCTEKNLGITNENASYFLSASLLLFTIGRFTGTALMKVIAPNRLLSLYAAINVMLCGVAVMVPNMIGIYAMMGTFFFESIMFPTIFALGVQGLGNQTKRGSSFIIMAIVGGAIVPYVMGSFASTASAYIVPMFSFVVVLYFGLKGYKVKS